MPILLTFPLPAIVKLHQLCPCTDISECKIDREVGLEFLMPPLDIPFIRGASYYSRVSGLAPLTDMARILYGNE